jgi:NADH-quinone oxidoreductase subunit N
MAIFLFSLAGIPPLAGFIGKFYLFAAVIKEQFYLLALIAGINSVLSLYYYARIVRAMFLDFPAGGERAVAVDWSNGALLSVLTVLTVVLGVYWAPVIALADRSVRFLMG